MRVLTLEELGQVTGGCCFMKPVKIKKIKWAKCGKSPKSGSGGKCSSGRGSGSGSGKKSGGGCGPAVPPPV